MKTIYNKLVRDRIPEIITVNGQTPCTRVLTTDEYKHALLDKLVEEAMELRESKGSMSERADIAEVLQSIDSAFNFREKDIEREAKAKCQTRGAFDDRIFLEYVE